MKLDLYINEANDYVRDIRVPILHPHVAIIHYDEVGEIRHSLNRIDCYGKGRQRTGGLPSVKYCASELCLSPGYFGDIVRGALGESPKDYIRGFIIMRAKSLMLGGMSITQVSDALGFGYPNHFTRLFKQLTGQTPSQFFAEQREK